MSIWCSWPQVGYDVHAEEPLRGGEVLTFAQGFSNHFPDSERTHELPAAIDLAHIAPWCVPGHDEPCPTCGGGHDHPEVGPWVRLSVRADAGLSFWAKDEDGNPIQERVEADVVLDEAAALRLFHDLGDWLQMPKVHPNRKVDR